MQHLQALPQEICSAEMIVSWELFEELIQLAQKVKISEQELSMAYRKYAPVDWSAPRGRDEAGTLALMMGKLAQAQYQADGTVPILGFIAQLAHIQEQSLQGGLHGWIDRAAQTLKFIARLAHIQEQSFQGGLHGWIDRAAKEYGLDEEELVILHQNKHSQQAPLEISPYLLMKVRPDNLDQNFFYIEAWFLEQQKEYMKCLYVDEEPRKLETIPELLEKLLEECHGYIGNSRIIIEIFLPFALLNYNVDQWMIDAGFGEMVSVSNYYPLVIRSLDRAYSSKKMVRDAWRRSWSIFEAHMVALKHHEAHMNALKRRHLCRSDCEHEKLLTELLDITCLTFTFMLPESSDESTRKIFKKLVAAGVPIALWPRWNGKHFEDHEIQNMYESFLPDCDFSLLPQVIWEKRRKADQHHLIHNLALLWDDPNRLPPDVQADVKFTAPLLTGKEVNHG